MPEELEIQNQEESPKPKSYISGLHQNLVAAYGKDKVPDEATFTKNITSSSDYLKGVYQNLTHAYGQDNVPDFTQFESYVKKKDGGTLSFLSKSPSQELTDLNFLSLSTNPAGNSSILLLIESIQPNLPIINCAAKPAFGNPKRGKVKRFK